MKPVRNLKAASVAAVAADSAAAAIAAADSAAAEVAEATKFQ
jgi:hypothetical protein